MIIKNVTWTDNIASVSQSCAEMNLCPEGLQMMQERWPEVEFKPNFHTGDTPRNLLAYPVAFQQYLDNRGDPAGNRPFLLKFPVRGKFSSQLASLGHFRGEGLRDSRTWSFPELEAA